MEVSEYLVGSPAFKAGGTGDPRTAGSIPVHLRHTARVAWVATLCAGVALFTSVSLILAQPAGAGARLLTSIPEDGASLEALEMIEFEFDTLLVPAGAMITVTRLDGTDFAVGDTAVERTVVRAVGPDALPSGNYEVAYDVTSSDGDRNQGSIRISIDAPGQALGGGLIAVIVIASALGLFATFVFAPTRNVDDALDLVAREWPRNIPSGWNVSGTMRGMRIGELADLAHVSTKTIRYYESIGLLAEPSRSDSGYRQYDETAGERLGFIRDAQATGLSLAEIASVLELKNNGVGSCAHTTQLLDRHLSELDAQIDRLVEARASLRSLADRGRSLDPTTCTDPNRCQVISPPPPESP